MRYTNVVFDLDGTLIDSEGTLLRTLQQLLAERHGRTVDIESLRFCSGIPGQEALRRLGVADIDATLELWDQRSYGEEIPLFDGVADMLEALARRYRLGIVTSQNRAGLRRSLTGRFPGLERLFSHIVCSDDTARHKPDPEPLLHYAALAGAGGGEILYIGDSVYDERCARGAGADFGLAAWGAHCARDSKAAYTFPHPADVVRLLC